MYISSQPKTEVAMKKKVVDEKVTKAEEDVIAYMKSKGFVLCKKHLSFFPAAREEAARKKLAEARERGMAFGSVMLTQACPACESEEARKISVLLRSACSPGERAQHARFMEHGDLFRHTGTQKGETKITIKKK